MISVIISALNEEASIREKVTYIFSQTPYRRLLDEVIVVDGGSTDGTIAEVLKTDATLIKASSKEASVQFNEGGRRASGRILYFLNARTLPPKDFITQIIKAFGKGFSSGTFSLRFDRRHWMLNAISWCTRREKPWIHISDQSLFMSRELFLKCGGFRQDYVLMANQEMIHRLKRYSNFIVLRASILASTRRYMKTGIYRTNLVQGIVYVLHKCGYHPVYLSRIYRRFLRWGMPPRIERPKAVHLEISAAGMSKAGA